MSLFDIPKLEEELNNLEKETIDPEFWNDQKNSQKILGNIKILKRIKENLKKGLFVPSFILC